MVLKVIQLNLFRGKYLDKAIDFLKKENPDIITLQEVTTNRLNLYEDKNANLFKILLLELGLEGVYHGDLKLAGDEKSTFGNAVFCKFGIKRHKIVVLKTFRPVEVEETDSRITKEFIPLFPRHILDVTAHAGNRDLHVICVHGAWTAPPEDTSETLRQADLIAGHIKSLGDSPYIMGGDFNMPPGSRVIEKISAVSTNFMIGSGVKQTTHPWLHHIAPLGFLVDYIFGSDQFSVRTLEVADVDISDHLPVVAQLEW